MKQLFIENGNNQIFSTSKDQFLDLCFSYFFINSFPNTRCADMHTMD